MRLERVAVTEIEWTPEERLKRIAEIARCLEDAANGWFSFHSGSVCQAARTIQYLAVMPELFLNNSQVNIENIKKDLKRFAKT